MKTLQSPRQLMMDRHFTCSVSDCGRPSARSIGAVPDICKKHFCAIHMSREFHKCSAIGELDDAAWNGLITGEIDRLRAQIDDDAVCQLASRLNNDRPSTIEHPPRRLMGCANYHARIRFENTSQSWLMRVTRVSGFAAGLPVVLAEYLIHSEYATLRFLETTKVPAPRAFAFGIPSQGTDLGVGVCFLLMEEMPGKPWNGQGDPSKDWKGLAEVYAELERHPLPLAGSLCVESSDDKTAISAVASDRFVCIDPFGPFEASEAYYTAWTEQNLTLIASGQLYPQYPIKAYLVYRFLKDNIHQLCDGEQQFFLKHVDDKGDHIMVDEDLNITGIIDWQMARVVPKREAFALSLVSADMASIYAGKVSVSANDIALREAVSEKRPGLAVYMGDERVRRFFWGLGLEPNWDFAAPLAKAILQDFGVHLEWDQWKTVAMKQYKDDERLRCLVKDALFKYTK